MSFLGYERDKFQKDPAFKLYLQEIYNKSLDDLGYQEKKILHASTGFKEYKQYWNAQGQPSSGGYKKRTKKRTKKPKSKRRKQTRNKRRKTRRNRRR